MRAIITRSLATIESCVFNSRREHSSSYVNSMVIICTVR